MALEIAFGEEILLGLEREQLAAARGDAKLLNERIDTAREKLALLIDRLPD